MLLYPFPVISDVCSLELYHVMLTKTAVVETIYACDMSLNDKPANAFVLVRVGWRP
jgi:hypothetical protein